MSESKIEWTENTWNPIRGCSRVSPGCEHCYAERQAYRFAGPGQPYEGLTRLTAKNGPVWNGMVRLVPELLAQPLSWRRPCHIFVNSMGDLFHERVPIDFVAAVVGVMLLTPRHTYQSLTKRAARMLAVMRRLTVDACVLAASLSPLPQDARDLAAHLTIPPSNLWLGVSVEDQQRAAERIPLLLQTPAAVRFVSIEPLLEDMGDMRRYLSAVAIDRYEADAAEMGAMRSGPFLDLVIVGGESGHNARPCNPDWIRRIVQQCRSAGVACFVKQLGSNSVDDGGRVHLRHRKGGDPAEWPMDLRVRELPEVETN